ncbi:PEP-CTERM sorting domain-containing protein [Accumulibacter sp.]|uniref:PEP-CTERM sorting domain-containing protein n=1 Tax=Accumulibacter sp. TaxID=2053492 RepID=UPI002605107A|nr:PEP-CTERM sorting domain-containing protein [Accumulibacter sp.]
MKHSAKPGLFAMAAGAALVALTLTPEAGFAAPLTVASYAMNNGAHGTFNYRDFSYSACAGVCDTTNAALSGGTGKLTDGVLPGLNWNQYGENTPWVGWDSNQNALYPGQTNPQVSFNFGRTVSVNSITVWVDASLGAGGVWHPASVVIDGTSYAIPLDGSDPAPRAYTFSGLGITGSSVNLQFFQQTFEPWIMVGEVSFDGTPVPEPGSLALLGLGLAGIGLILTRRRAD